MTADDMHNFDFNPFLRFRHCLHVAHHIPGRIRLRVKAALFRELGDDVDTKVLDEILKTVEAIKDVRVNAIAGSVVVSYDSDRLKPVWWETLINGEDSKAVALLKQLMANDPTAVAEITRQIRSRS